MEEFAKQFLARKKVATRHGDREKIAKAAGLSLVAVSRWGNYVNGSLKLPTILECEQAAKALGVTPGWLAFGEGSSNPAASELGHQFAARFADNPDLAHIYNAWLQATDEDKALLKAWAKKIPTKPKQTTETPEHLKPTGPELHHRTVETLSQTSAEVIVDHDVIAPGRVTAITPAAPKGIPPGFVKPEKKVRTNRRGDYRIVPIVKKGSPGAVGIPCFESVAAGFGEDLERSEDLVHVRSLPYWKNVHSLVVRGDSMEETLHPRDLILIETLNNGDGITLEGLQQGEPKTPYRQIQRSIPDDEIYVLSIDNEPPTVKRVLYDVSKENDWYLIISADNNTYKPRVLSRQTPIRFYGRLIAIGQKDGAPVYSDRKTQQFPDRIEKKLKR